MKENVCMKNVAVKKQNEKEPDNYQLKKVKKEENTIQNYGKKQKKDNRKWCMHFFVS